MSSPLSQVIEASSGALLVILIAMIVFNVIYLARKLREFGEFKDVYVECKSAIATLVFQVGFMTWVAAIWTTMYLRNHGYETKWLREPIAVIIAGAIVVATIGGICWIRLITPRDPFTGERYVPVWTWWAIALGAVAFGVTTVLWGKTL